MTSIWDFTQTSESIENQRTLITRYIDFGDIHIEKVLVVSPSSYDYSIQPTKPTTLTNSSGTWWREKVDLGQYVSLYPTNFADGFIRHRRIVRDSSTYTNERQLVKDGSVRRESFNRNIMSL